MYAKSQLASLFAKLNALHAAAITGSGPDAVTTIDPLDLKALMAEAQQLQALDQTLILGTHEHKHGDSTYLFLVPAGVQMSDAQFEARLQEEFEPDAGEFLTVEALEAPVVLNAEDLQG